MSATVEKLKEILHKTTEKEIVNELSGSESLSDAGIDSLDLMDFYLNLEDEFEIQIPDTDVEGLHTLQDFVTYVNGKL